MSRSKNIQLGAFLVVGILVVTISTLYLRGMSLKPRVEWTVYFDGDSIVEEGFEVYYAGMRVGTVTHVEPVPAAEYSPERQVVATAKINEDITIWNDGELVIRTRGLIGGYRAELTRGTPATGLRSPDEPLPARMQGDVTERINAVVEENREALKAAIENLRVITGEIRGGQGSLGSFINDKEMADDARRFFRNLREVSDSLNDPDGLIRQVLDDKTLAPKARTAVTALSEILDNINRGRGTIGRLVNDDVLIADLERSLKRIGDIAADLQAGKGTVGMLLKDEEAAANTKALIIAARQFSEKLGNGEGTIGMLLDDPRIFDNLLKVSEDFAGVAGDINAGRGTLGRLVKRDDVYNELQRMLESFRESGDIARENIVLGSLTSFTSLFFNVLN
ncbi:MAG: MlaD family protein [Planctomycetota bacterium]|jgi:phospholipid/cholesterol/gamma-HCH transport system substrate-binding protein